MKKNITLIFVTFIFLFIESCEDIVVSDNNIKKTAIKYGHELENQESSVIMPLKVGNVWYYEVRDINQWGYCSGLSLDSIKVLSEVMIENERWFEVYFPIISKEYNVLMTNTDKGLWVKCDECEEKSFLWAKYPEIDGIFESGKREYISTDGNGDILKHEIESIGKKASPISIRYSNSGIIETTKYEVYSMNDNATSTKLHLADEYFKPDFGLIKVNNVRIWDFPSKNYQYVELQNYGKIDTNECRNNPRISFGNIKSGEPMQGNYRITNPFDEVIFFSDADILVVNDNPNIIIKMKSLFQWRRLGPSEAMDIEFSINPDQVGTFTSTIFIRCQLGCWYSIKLVGECIP